MKKILRVSTIPLSIKVFCRDLLLEIKDTYSVGAVSSPGDDLEAIAADGIPVHGVPMRREIAPLSDLKSLWRLYRLFRRERPDMVHSITPKAGLLSMMAARMAGVPVRVHSFTGLLFPTATGLKRRILMLTDAVTCLCATHILPEGQGVMADLQNAGITRKPMRVLGHGNVRGVDTSHFSLSPAVRTAADALRASLGIPVDAFVFVFAGRLVRDKGIVELIDAYTRLHDECKGVHLLLVGVEEPQEDPLPEDTRITIRTMKSIHHSDGWIDDVRPYYAAADALVFPSYREGFPNVVLEAGAMQLPSVVTDINGSREIITPGVNGTIVPPADSDALYLAMKQMMANPAACHNMGIAARANVKSRFEASYVRQCLKDFYTEVL